MSPMLLMVYSFSCTHLVFFFFFHFSESSIILIVFRLSPETQVSGFDWVIRIKFKKKIKTTSF
jgi:hypothetical protein